VDNGVILLEQLYRTSAALSNSTRNSKYRQFVFFPLLCFQ
jgi:hypothetical protein